MADAYDILERIVAEYHKRLTVSNPTVAETRLMEEAQSALDNRPLVSFWAVFVDETGVGEFGAEIRAVSKDKAWEIAREEYPESRCVQLESPEDAAAREKRMYDRINAEYDDGPMYEEDYA